ncbi:MAG: XRE family transcriptional regulator [Halofilum sp. (in: g-proteobacteria)]|nr:XRE family transcriptional regulator [Halofilum sp. (in: g-proteobacteria)]
MSEQPSGRDDTPESPEYPAERLGETLRRVRRSRHLTLAALSERSGVSRSMLSEIERGSVNPTVGVLWNLTFALGIEIGDLLSNASVADGGASVIEHIKSYSTPELRSADGSCVLRILSPARTLLPIEWYEMQFEGGGTFDAPAYRPGTYLYLTLQDGVLTASIGGRTVEVDPGDTLRFPGDQAIHLRAGKGAARALLVVAHPESYDGPVRQR